MEPIWKPRNLNEGADVPSFSIEGLPPLIGEILHSRGFVENDNIDKLLFPKLSELKDPNLIFGMEKAVDRVVQALRQKQKICIYADFDLDGTSGLALLLTGMQALGFQDVVYFQPKRLKDGYGFHAEAVRELKKQNVELIITVDVGITAHHAVETANELGIDVIITDHHLPLEKIPPALVVVNPNQPLDQSGLGYLCGAGVAFYLLRALKRKIFESSDLPHLDFDLKNVLDFFTIGTLTDMVPLVDDNRVLVKHGLHSLAETQKPGLRALLNALELSGRPLNSQDVAIRFAPKLNALSRMESGLLPIDIFLTTDKNQAEKWVGDILRNNHTRVQLQNEAELEAIEKLKTWTNSDFVIVASENFHRGVVGLIATKLAQNFNRPAFVGSIDEDQMIVGSCRVPPGSEECLVTALGSAEKILTRFGGHSAAAGFELPLNEFEKLVEKLTIHFEEMKKSPKAPEYYYDSNAVVADLSHHLMKWYEFVGPFGAGFQIPVLKLSSLNLKNKKELKGGHYRLTMLDQDQLKTIECLLFSPSERQMKILNSGADFFDLIGELQWNYFAGKKSIQLLVKDLKVSERES